MVKTMSLVRPITRADIKGPAIYAGIRDDYRRHIIALKKARRVVIGDKVSLVFDNRHTLIMQIEEVLHHERATREDQIQEEIASTNSLMPTRDSLAATLFIEKPQDADAYTVLNELVGLDEHVVLHVGDHVVRASFEPGRSTAERISAVQYLRFALTPAMKQALAMPGTPIVVEIDHPRYTYTVTANDALRASLAADYKGET